MTDAIHISAIISTELYDTQPHKLADSPTLTTPLKMALRETHATDLFHALRHAQAVSRDTPNVSAIV